MRRFTPEYRIAFDAWLETDPFDDPQAPAGPAHMPEYRNPKMEEATRLNDSASALFDKGTQARETSNRFTCAPPRGAEQSARRVLFATVLFLIAIAQRFRVRNVRIGAIVLAFTLLAYTMFTVSTLPRT